MSEIRVTGKSKYVHLIGFYNPENGHVLIKAGSRFRTDKTKHLLPHIVRFREKVLDEIGTIDGLTKKDYDFKSPGAAACVLCASMTNGLDFFVLDDGRTINEAFFACKAVSISELEENEDNEIKPLLLPEDKKYKRIYSVGKNALKNSGYVCFVDPEHETFLTDEGLPYMEAHHLIPFKFQKDFKYSLQVPANIVCLCPQCHRELHYGKNRKKILRKLYDDRKKDLEKSGIFIEFEDLLKCYVLKKNK